MNFPLRIYKSSAGTGKTFTLAAYYVSLLMRGDSFRSILAVTFTNKATAEMKERILTHLYLLSQCPTNPTIAESEAGFLWLVKKFLKEESVTLSDADIYSTAAELFPVMIENYDGISVTTIDSFLQQLLSGLAHAVNTAAGYRVDLDSKQAISLAVDQIMSSHINEQPGLKEAVVSYVKERLESEENWDVRANMRKLADELFKEDFQTNKKTIQTEPKAIDALKKAVDWTLDPIYTQARQLCDRLLLNMPTVEKLSSTFKTMVNKFDLSLQGVTKDGKDLFPELASTGLKKLSSTPANALEQQCLADVAALLALRADLRARCLRQKYTLKHLNDLIMLTFIREQINRNQLEDNTLLLADTAFMLSEALKPGDADFILEKAGLKYHHVLLDEFQDTSRMQWANFLQLLREILSSDGSVLVVGDIKQSIYRWRNGDWKIMKSLATTLGGAKEVELQINRRSLPEVVRFNLETMRFLTQSSNITNTSSPVLPAIYDPEAQNIYNEKFDGEDAAPFLKPFDKDKDHPGFVRIRAYPYSKNDTSRPAHKDTETAILADMFDTIGQLREHGVAPSDCLILCKTKRDARAVIRYFATIDKTSGPFLNVSLSSSDSFLLEASPAVCVVVSALRYRIRNDKAALAYVEHYTHRDVKQQIDDIDKCLPLLDLMERMIEICLCTDGEYMSEDLVYLNSLKDKTRNYIASYGADVDAFLTHYDEKMHQDAVPATKVNSIRVMTIHASKGLEGRFVFIPFCHWNMEDTKGRLWSPAAVVQPDAANYIPIPHSSSLLETSTEAEQAAHSPLANYTETYQKEHSLQRVDNMNVLYVALTRAREALYIYMQQAVAEASKRDTKAKEKLDVGYLLLESRGLIPDLYDQIDNYSADDASGAVPPCRVEWSVGQDPTTYQIETKENQSESPFATAETDSTKIASAYHSENHDIRFVQSQESAFYSMTGKKRAEQTIDRIEFGNICHDIFAEMVTLEDMDAAVRRFRQRGIIESDEMESEVREVLSHARNSEQMCSWFDGSWQLMREDSILVVEDDRVREYRPDRVMIRGNEAIILDYKFGHEHPKKYGQQLRGYMTLLRGMGYTSVSAYLWYAQQSRLQEVTE